uniref:Galectin domain-containing protein n=1 Tax=Haemonchus contortus TaxID=6289 RepID=A0A7I4Y739_HAECO
MGNGYLWLLSSNGVPYRVTADNRIEHISEAQWKSEPVVVEGEQQKIHQILAAPHAAFALDLNGNVFQFVLNSHLTIRRRVEIYANQRWYPVAGWSSRTLPTDRAAFSNEDGSKSGDMSGFQLKADGWRWEESWIVDVDVRKCDMEGWEYATNFAGAAWSPKKSVSSFVRRRRWKRHMRYTSIEKWAELPREEKTTFVELAVGGFDLLPDRNCLLFALSKDGYVYRRVGIDGNNPGGDSWRKIPEIESEEGREDLAKISCSASLGTLVVLTWDGRLFFRAGITRDCRDGTTWCPLLAPQNLPLAFISIGTRSMWVVSVDGKLWSKRLHPSKAGHEQSSFSELNYFEFGGEVYGLCINADDQVAGISDSGVIYVRDGVSPNEPAGRSFVRIVERTSTDSQKWAAVANSGSRYTSLPKHWVNEHVVVLATANFRYATWRKQILKDLCAANELCWEAFRSSGNDLEELMEEGQDPDSWNRKYPAKLRRQGDQRFQNGVVLLSSHQLMFQPATGNAVVKSLPEIISAIRSFDVSGSIFTILLKFVSPTFSEELEIGFSEESERDDWHELLQQEIRRRLLAAGDVKDLNVVWSVSSLGLIRVHLLSEPSFSTMVSSPSLCVRGCMQTVSAGAEDVVWALAKDGTVYALTPDYNLFSENNSNVYTQKADIIREIVEYQKHVFLRGFTSFQGWCNGVSGWMEASSAVNGLFEKLPSREWSWVDSEWRLVDKGKYEDGWTYADSIEEEYYASKGKKSKARRRRWQRLCRFECKGPWIPIEAPSIRSIDVQKKKADRILVWAVTVDGQVLLRQGVSSERPQGTTWKHIVGDYVIDSILSASPTCVWATTTEGRLLRRECPDQTDMECVDWSEVVYSPLRKVFSFCVWEDFVFLLPADNPQLIVVDVNRGTSKLCLSIPKATYITLDKQGNLYYCDGASIVQLERYTPNGEQPWEIDFRSSGKISDGGYARCCFK